MIFGVDTASVAENKDVNWTQAKAEGPLGFAILRAVWGTSVDQFFLREWDRLKASGLVAGTYMFLRFRTEKNGPAPTPAAQARAMIDAVDGRLQPGTDFPPALDVEFPKGRAETGLSAAALLDGVREAWSLLRDHFGVPPIVYTSQRVWVEDLDNLPASDLTDSPLWVPRYLVKSKLPAILDAARAAQLEPQIPSPWGGGDSWFVHQYQGDAIDMPGFPTGNVDLNRFHSASKGSQGGHVGWIQRRLGMAAPTQVFDDATDAKVRELQAASGLVADGVVGPKTFARLCWR